MMWFAALYSPITRKSNRGYEKVARFREKVAHPNEERDVLSVPSVCVTSSVDNHTSHLSTRDCGAIKAESLQLKSPWGKPYIMSRSSSSTWVLNRSTEKSLDRLFMMVPVLLSSMYRSFTEGVSRSDKRDAVEMRRLSCIWNSVYPKLTSIAARSYTLRYIMKADR